VSLRWLVLSINGQSMMLKTKSRLVSRVVINPMTDTFAPNGETYTKLNFIPQSADARSLDLNSSQESMLLVDLCSTPPRGGHYHPSAPTLHSSRCYTRSFKSLPQHHHHHRSQNQIRIAQKKGWKRLFFIAFILRGRDSYFPLLPSIIVIIHDSPPSIASHDACIPCKSLSQTLPQSQMQSSCQHI
jgi:hypothetical protein